MEKYISLADVTTNAKPVVSHIRKNNVGQLTQRKHQETISLQERISKEEEIARRTSRGEGTRATVKKEEEIETDPNHLGM